MMNNNADETGAATAEAEGSFPNPRVAATAIVSYYPELVDVDATTKPTVKGYIQNASGFGDLVKSISTQGQPDWAPPTDIILENGQPAKDPQGNIIKQLILSETTTAAMIAPIAQALSSVRADTTLENILWTSQQGIAPSESASKVGSSGTQWTLTEVGPRFGVAIPSISFDYSNNTFQLQLTNKYSRHLAVYVEFTAEGKVITPSQWTSRLPAQLPATFETDTLKYLGVLRPANHVAGI